MTESDRSKRFVGQVVLVTGGARNIGFEIARSFAREGAKVAIAARGADSGSRAAAELRSSGAEAVFLRTDISQPDHVANTVAATVDQFGGLNILINNAAIMEHATHGAQLADITVEHWMDYVENNVTGPFLCTKFAIPAILNAGGGAIVNISSTAAYFARAEGGGYGISKSTTGALTRYCAVDYGPSIRCNEVILGSVQKESPIFDLINNDPEIAHHMRRSMHAGRLGLPEDVANACLFLCSAESSYITGTALLLDGGAHITSPMPDWPRVRALMTEAGVW